MRVKSIASASACSVHSRLQRQSHLCHIWQTSAPVTVQPATAHGAAINFMNNSSLGMDGASEPFASASSQPLQQPQEDSLPKAPAAPQQPQAPQQTQQQPGQGAQPQQQPPAGGFARPQQQGSGALNASDAEVPAPGRGRGGDRWAF